MRLDDLMDKQLLDQDRLNRELDAMIGASNITPLMKEVFNIIQNSYTNPDQRPSKLTLSGIDLEYKRDKSTGLYSHYENDKTIIVGIHGADDTRLNRIAVTQIINPDINNRDIQEFCDKFREILSTGKELYLFSHSLGFWLTASCKEATNTQRVKGLSFGGFAPNSTTPQIRGIAASRSFKKILFDNDWLASRILETPEQHNILVLKPFDTRTRVYSHGIGNLANDINVLNSNIVRYIP